MSLFEFEDIECAVCGAVNSYYTRKSTGESGAPDLDRRPYGLIRSTLASEIHECPNCGYVSDRVSDKHNVTLEYLRSEDYLGCDGLVFASELAKQFYRCHKIYLQDGDHSGASVALIYASWACDDSGDEENACKCRKLAADILAKAVGECEDRSIRESMLSVKADLLRRSGHFRELLEEFAGMTFEDELVTKIIEFEIKKAGEEDRGCYRISDVTEYKAPYVIHC